MFIKLPLKDDDLVLEIGSGHNPHPRADILCDSSFSNDKERQRQSICLDRPLIIGDGQKLPFKDKSFAFVYCSQVLEHAKNPLQFVKELERISKRGLIIVPSVVRERLFGWEYHRWYFIKKKQKVYFFPKKETSPLSILTHALFAKTLWFRREVIKKEKTLNIYFFWKDKLKIEPLAQKEKTKTLEKADLKVQKFLGNLEFSWLKDLIFWFSWMSQRLKQKIYKLFYRYIKKR